MASEFTRSSLMGGLRQPPAHVCFEALSFHRHHPCQPTSSRHHRPARFQGDSCIIIMVGLGGSIWADPGYEADKPQPKKETSRHTRRTDRSLGSSFPSRPPSRLLDLQPTSHSRRSQSRRRRLRSLPISRRGARHPMKPPKPLSSVQSRRSQHHASPPSRSIRTRHRTLHVQLRRQASMKRASHSFSAQMRSPKPAR